MQKRPAGKEEEWSNLMRLALAGDVGAYKTLLGAVAPHLRGIIRPMLMRSGRGLADLEDIVQETILAVHLKRATWDPSFPFLPWLNAVARYKAIDALRKSGFRVHVDIDTMSESMAAPDERRDSTLDSATILNALDPKQRKLVEQIIMVGRSSADVGAELGMSEGAVRVALHRSLRRLEKIFGKSRNEN